jgi:uncharacterized membrane protein YphA (DoxX/SURF4 family)
MSHLDTEPQSPGLLRTGSTWRWAAELWARSDRERRVALISGLIFIPAGLIKFAFHHWELQAFYDFGIPAAAVMEPIVGALETIGGVLLLLNRSIIPTAFTLAVIMVVAFITGGIIHAEPIPSDTLAPALLVAMIYLLVRRLRERRAAPQR